MREHIRLEYQKQEQLRTKLRYLSPKAVLHNRRQYAADLVDQLRRGMRIRLEKEKHRVQLFAQRLEAGSPAKKLSQGFSFVTDARGIPLQNVSQTRIGEDITVRTLDGKIKAAVSQIIPRQEL